MDTALNKLQKNMVVTTLVLTILFSFATITLKPVKTHAWPANTTVGYCKKYTRTAAGVPMYVVRAVLWNRSSSTYSFKLNWRTTTADQQSVLKIVGPNSVVTSESGERPSYGQTKIDVQTNSTGWITISNLSSC